MVKCTGPVMVEQVRLSVSRCTVPSCSIPTSAPACSTVFPRSHLGGRTEGMEVSHSNQAGAGSITVTSCRPRTIVMDFSVGERPVTGAVPGEDHQPPLLQGWCYFLGTNPLRHAHFLPGVTQRAQSGPSQTWPPLSATGCNTSPGGKKEQLPTQPCPNLPQRTGHWS